MSVSWGTQYAKLKTNLRLAANRLKLQQKKKTEQAIKARIEIADFLNSNKEDRARIRVENIIREDFVVEAYELLEMYCEFLLARFGIIQQMKELDDGIAEAVSSLLWVAPRIGHEISELKAISDELTHKYGKQFAEAARMNQLPEPSRVSPKLVQKLSVSAPSKLLVEKYLMTIAQSAGIEFAPDPKVMRDDDDEIDRAERNLINFMNEEQYGWSVKPDEGGVNGKGNGPGDGSSSNFGGGGGSSIVSGAHQQPYPMAGFPPPDYAAPPPPSYPTPNLGNYPMPMPNAAASVHAHQQFGSLPPAHPQPSEHIYETPPAVHYPPATNDADSDFLMPKFPEPPKDVPTNKGPGANGPGNPPPPPNNMSGGKPPIGGGEGDLDFDALAKRFEDLKKKI